MKDLYDLGERPPLGQVPARMYAYVVRQTRFGPPRDAWKREVITTPVIGPDEVLVYVMAPGSNDNTGVATVRELAGVCTVRTTQYRVMEHAHDYVTQRTSSLHVN